MSALGTSDAVSPFARVLCVVVGMSLLSSCLGQSTYVWNEEVLVHDGRIIVIKRSVKTGNVPVEIGQPPGESNYTLTFNLPSVGDITWEGGQSFLPMIRDFHHSVPYVVAAGRTSPDYERNGCPRPPYFIFRYADGRWERIAYEQLPKEVRRSNLLVDTTYDKSRLANVKSGLVTVSDVERSHRGLDRQYKEVREDAINPCAHRGNDYKYTPPS